jgi:hypothetical protein
VTQRELTPGNESTNETADDVASTESTESTGTTEAPNETLARSSEEGRTIELPSGKGPDPVVGAGMALLGIFTMGVGGARDLHWLFDIGVLCAVVGAGVFVLFVALSALQSRRAETPRES